VLGRILNGAVRVVRSVNSRLRVIALRSRFPGVEIGRNVLVHAGVAFSITGNGKLKIADNVAFTQNAVIIVRDGHLTIGADAYVGGGTHIVSIDSISIGRNALIAEHVTIRDQDHDFTGPLPTALNGFKTAPIVIGDNVWIGAKATIVKGVRIGNNAVIGANSVVTSNIPDDAVAAGVPARVLRIVERRRGGEMPAG
jgi:acetyltransferase-like isoleucine patch superfamily enzyme